MTIVPGGRASCCCAPQDDCPSRRLRLKREQCNRGLQALAAFSPSPVLLPRTCNESYVARWTASPSSAICHSNDAASGLGSGSRPRLRMLKRTADLMRCRPNSFFFCAKKMRRFAFAPVAPVHGQARQASSVSACPPVRMVDHSNSVPVTVRACPHAPANLGDSQAKLSFVPASRLVAGFGDQGSGGSCSHLSGLRQAGSGRQACSASLLAAVAALPRSHAIDRQSSGI